MSELQPALQVLLEKHDLFLFDAYGVLTSDTGLCAGAREFLELLQESKRDFFILTNDASKTLEQAEQYYSGKGLPVTIKNIISSGSLVKDYFMEAGLSGASCLVFGPEQARSYVSEAGGVVLPFHENSRPDCIVLLDTSNELDTGGHDLHSSLNTLITVMLAQHERGHKLNLILANPDLIYPQGQNRFGLAVGSVANILESHLDLRYPGQELPRFKRIGKPFPEIYQKALELRPAKAPVMFGDQIATDIFGAKALGIFGVLMLTGVTTHKSLLSAGAAYQPDLILPSFAAH